jgi:hypothetical protein
MENNLPKGGRMFCAFGNWFKSYAPLEINQKIVEVDI